MSACCFTRSANDPASAISFYDRNSTTVMAFPPRSSASKDWRATSGCVEKFVDALAGLPHGHANHIDFIGDRAFASLGRDRHVLPPCCGCSTTQCSGGRYFDAGNLTHCNFHAERPRLDFG